jgi:hypothetical protein
MLSQKASFHMFKGLKSYQTRRQLR